MKLKIGELQKQINKQEEEKATLQRDIEEKMCRLDEVNASLSKKTAVRDEYDRTIAEAEAAYSKVYVCIIIFGQTVDFIKHDQLLLCISQCWPT